MTEKPKILDYGVHVDQEFKETQEILNNPIKKAALKELCGYSVMAIRHAAVAMMQNGEI